MFTKNKLNKPNIVCVFPVPGQPWINKISFLFISLAFIIASVWDELNIFFFFILSKYNFDFNVKWFSFSFSLKRSFEYNIPVKFDNSKFNIAFYSLKEEVKFPK